MIFRIRYQIVPFAPHVHCSLFVARGPNQTFVLCGTLSVRAGEEFEALKAAFQAEFIERGDPATLAEIFRKDEA